MEEGSCFPDLLPSKGFPTEHSSLLDNGGGFSKAPQQHLTKNRPRVRKTRAPTRVTLLSDSSSAANKQLEVNNNSSQFSEIGATSAAAARLDEGLDSFFPSIRVSLANGAASSASANSLDIKEIISLPTIKESPNGGVLQQSAQAVPPPLSARPQPQPRKQPNLLRKFGFAKSTEQPPSEQSFSVKVINASTELSPSSNANSSSSSTNSHITLKNEDFMRAPSPTFFSATSASKRSEHVSICSESEGGRGGSPVPVGDNSHNEFLAEMRAKQKEAKRSHGSTPLNESLTFAGTLAEQQNMKLRSSPEQTEGKTTSAELNNNNNNSVGSNGSGNIAKRATIFGELHKSPSKASITQACSGFASGGSSSGEEGSTSAVSSSTPSNSNFTSSTSSSIPKQRPKSMVGILGAKFELSLMNSSGNK